MKLYEISKDYLSLLDMATDPELDIPPEQVMDTLTLLEGDFYDKAIAVAGYFQNIEADIEAMKEAEERIRTRRKFAENHVKSLREYLKAQMQSVGINKLSCPYYEVSISKCPPSVDVFELALVPREFIKVTVTEQPDKTAIKNAGGCPGARLVTDKTTLRVK